MENIRIKKLQLIALPAQVFKVLFPAPLLKFLGLTVKGATALRVNILSLVSVKPVLRVSFVNIVLYIVEMAIFPLIAPLALITLMKESLHANSAPTINIMMRKVKNSAKPVQTL